MSSSCLTAEPLIHIINCLLNTPALTAVSFVSNYIFPLMAPVPEE